MIAFPEYKSIEILDSVVDKHKSWLLNYEGLNYSKALEGKHLMKWKTEPKKYNPDKFESSINMISRKPNRLVIEYDCEPVEKAQENLQKTYRKLKKYNFGFIRSTHKGKTDYLWIEFTRDLTTEESKRFLNWISPKDSIVDLNFTSDKKVFPVLFSIHWKHSTQREIPIEFFKGKQIDFDSLDIPKEKIKTRTISKNGFDYEILDNLDRKPITIQELLKGKIPKEKPIIKKFFPEKSLNIIFGEPASCKSLFLNYIALCISSKTKFLNKYPIRKSPCLFISTENSELLDKKRFRAVSKGLNINPRRRKYDNLPLLIQSRKNIGYLTSDVYFSYLKRMIKENSIKVLLIDTISPMISDLNDNLANEIVEVFKRFFDLIDEYGLCIICSMHSQKTGRDFLGSIKIKAGSDCFYELKRNDNLFLLCHKNRNGEHNLKMDINFIERQEQLEKVTFEFVEEYQGKQSPSNKNNNVSKSKECDEFILEILKENELKYNEIVKECQNQGFNDIMAKRRISSLYKSKKILKKPTQRGGYYVS